MPAHPWAPQAPGQPPEIIESVPEPNEQETRARAELEAEVDAEMAAAEVLFQAERQRLLDTLPRVSDAYELVQLIESIKPAAILQDGFHELGTVVVRVDKESGEASQAPLAIVAEDMNCSARELMAEARQADLAGPYATLRGLPISHADGAYYPGTTCAKYCFLLNPLS